jgi:Uma2 family endonuclease
LKEDGYIHGAPDLIVEVLSSDKKRDTVKKKNLYERAGVKEYYIVDPANRKVQAYALKNSLYEMHYERDGLFKSPLLELEFTF